jgi:hypothetical protein
LTPTVLEVLSPEFAELFLEEKSPVASLRLDVEAWTVLAGFEGSAEVCERYRRDLSRLARIAAARDAIAVHDSQFLSLVEILREAPAAMSRITKNAMVLRFVTLPGKLADMVRALRSFATSSWMSAAILIRGASIVYVALLPSNGDESALKGATYFWKSVGSLRGQMEFNASILFCPVEWKDQLGVWAYAGGDLELGQRVKKAFDPGGTFARGRFAEGV